MLSFVNWATDADSLTTYRWLLAAAALGYVVVSLLLRGAAPRHAEQMVNAAGLAVLAIGLTGVRERRCFRSWASGDDDPAQRLGARRCSPPAAA